MKSNLFAKVLNLFLFVLVSFAMSARLVGPAFAKPSDMPTCQFSSTSGYTGDAPFTVTLIAPFVNSGNYNWHFGDNSAGATEKIVSHTYYGVGRYTISLVVVDNDHIYRGCSTEVNVTLGETSATGQPVVTTQDPTSTPIVGSESETTSETAEGLTTGDGSPIINNSGDGNPITFTTASSQPIVIEPEPVVTQRTNWFTAIIHAFLKANEVFLHTLDESWFKPELVN